MRQRPGPGTTIGMSAIKEQRLSRPVPCHLGDYVGDYVPFYFCSRSVMLYMVHKANDPQLSYRGGQEPIVHLEADLRDVVAWADSIGRKWAFTLCNARAGYADFRSSLDDLGDIDWAAVNATRWGGQGISSDVKEGKQAEFLIHGSFPWYLVSRIGVLSVSTSSRVSRILARSQHCPKVEIKKNWYY